MAGQVVDENFRPLPEVRVYVKELVQSPSIVAGPAATDAVGQFRIAVIAGRRYHLSAELPVVVDGHRTFRTGDVPEFVAEPGTDFIRIIIRRR